MNDRHTLLRSLHDVGGAAWFGGALMGAVGLNGASRAVADPTDRSPVASAGWARWAPVAATAIGAHLVGGAGLLVANRDRVRGQSGVTANTVAKTLLTAGAVATTAYSGILGARLAAAGHVPALGGVSPSVDTPSDVASDQRRLQVLQWVTPAMTAVILALSAQQGEQQRPREQLLGAATKLARSRLKRS